jgi:hypothetical protein
MTEHVTEKLTGNLTGRLTGNTTGHENPHAGRGSVLLDIGDDVGALVVAMPTSMLGQEIEIAPARGRRPKPAQAHPHGHHDALGHVHDHTRGHRPHVAVVDRPVTMGTLPSLVFPDLVEGCYELFDKGQDAVLLTAAITGGRVTFLEWPTG